MSSEQNKIMGYFIEETKEHLNTIDQSLLHLTMTVADPDKIGEAFRAAHSIKGGAAMLGINSIQQIAHALEDSFKVLKEVPIDIDQTLESLLLSTFDSLKRLFAQFTSGQGLTEQDAAEITAKAEPTIKELMGHLNSLNEKPRVFTPVHGSQARPANRAAPLDSMIQPAPMNQPTLLEDSALQLIFKSDVPKLLQLMLETFKQPDTASSRQHLGEICRNLLQAGETFELREWSELIQIVTLTCQNTHKTYHALAPVILKEIKQARQLVLTGKSTEIQPSQELKLLLPPVVAENTSIDKNTTNLNSETFITMTPNSPDSPNNWLISQLESIKSLSSDSTSAAPKNPSKVISLPSSNTGKTTYKHSGQEKLKGPEVGMDELNTLKDLFDGEEIAGWNEELFAEAEQILPRENLANSESNSDKNNEEDFSDLLLDFAESDLPESRSTNSPNYAQSLEAENDDDFFDELVFINENEADSGIKSQKNIADQSDNSFEDIFEIDDLNDASDAKSSSSVSQFEDLNSLFDEASDEELDIHWENEIENIGSKSAAENLEIIWDGDDEVFFSEMNQDSGYNSSSNLSSLTMSESTYIQDTPDLSEDDLDLSLLTELVDLDTDEIGVGGINKADLNPMTDSSTNLDDDLSYDELFSIADENESGLSLESDRRKASMASATESLEDLFGDLLESEKNVEEISAPKAVTISEDFADIFSDHEVSLDDLDLEHNSLDTQEDEPKLNFDSVETPEKRKATVDFSDLDNLFNDAAFVSANSSLNFEEMEEETEELDDLGLNDLNFGNEFVTKLLTNTDQYSADLNSLLERELSELNELSSANNSELFDDLLSPESVDIFDELDAGAISADASSNVSNPEDEFNVLESLLAQKFAPSSSSSVNFSALEKILDLSPTALKVDFNELEAFLNQKVIQNSEPLWLTELQEFLAPQKSDRLKPAQTEPIKGSESSREKSTQTFKTHSDSTAKKTRGGMTYETMRVPVKQLDNLGNLIGELVVNRNTLEQDQERMRQFLDNLLHQVQNLTDVGQRMQDLYERVLLEIALLSSRKNHFMPDGSLQIAHSTGHDLSVFEMDKFTPFHILAQEILELIVRVRESASDIEFLVDETDQVTRQLRQITNKLQEGINRSRMVPFAQITDRLPLGVRNNSIKFGKQVELVVEGAETLIDKMILESLNDPMTHLVNNALAHGIELPEERQRKGKPPTGRITVRAFHQGNQTVISVSDDGAGIDAERVKAKALDKGLITPAEAKTLSRLEVYDLLFAAGFSTKDQADDLAGRGVGLDVVRTNLSSIRGVVNTDSTLGKGTSFSIRVPLAFSISKALICISDRARIAFPMDGVEDMLDVPRDKIQTVSKDDREETFIPWRDTMLPFRPMRELLVYHRHMGRGSVFGGNAEEDIISVVVLRSAGNYLALQVDQVLGEQEIVIKQLEGPVPKPVGVAGATVMGDGRIVAIADVLELIDLAAGRITDKASTIWEDRIIPEETVEKEQPTVLIVDDSITVRELLSMTFNKAGYRVEQSRDGQEAWEKLKSGLPCDIVFCDIEMPRMDGLELLSRLQKDPQLSHLPMAMLTSRGAKKHMQMAIDMGARGYFTKPYLEEALLDAASRMLKGEVLVLSKTEV